MKKYLLKLLLLLSLPVISYAQQNYADSLKQALKNAKTDSARYETLGDLTYYYAQADVKTGLDYVDQRLVIARRNDHALDESATLIMKGFLLLLAHNYTGSMQCLEQALKLAEDPKNERKAWIRYNHLSPEKNRLDIIANVHLSWGHLMGPTNNPLEQVHQYQLTQSFAEAAGDTGLVGWAKQSRGDVYFRLNNLDSAMTLEKEAEPIIQKNYRQLFGRSGIKKYISLVDETLGSIYLKKGDKRQALSYFQKGVFNAIAQNDLASLIECCSDLSGFYFSEKQGDSSLYYAKKEVETIHHRRVENFTDGYKNLFLAYTLKNKNDSVLKYQGLALSAEDESYQASLKNLSDFQKQSFAEQLHVRDLEKDQIAAEARNRTIFFLGGIGVLMLLAFIFYRNYKQTRRSNQLLYQQKEEIQSTLTQLKSTQKQLVLREKMASLGELTTGIAHEIQNPLNFVNNFSEVNREMLEELKAESVKPKAERDEHLESDLINDLIENERKINHHGKRADSIVKGMLEHSRASTGEKQLTDLNVLCDEFMKLSYNGLRAKDKNFNADLVTHFDGLLPKANVSQQDMGRVMLNLFNNAFYAVNQKLKMAGVDYKPEVSVTTFAPPSGGWGVTVRDNGNGIPDAIKGKIMQPFFTTKPTGEGTGLGLSLSYDIVVNGHGGAIHVETQETHYTEFIITLPLI